MILETPLGILLGGRKRNIAQAIALGVFALVVPFPMFSTLPPVVLWWGVAIGVASVVPFYLWSRGFAPGLPVFPIFAVTHLWAFALPLLTGHPAVLAYDDEAIGQAAATVTGFLVLATVVWAVVARHPAQPQSLRIVRAEAAGGLVWVPVVATVIYNLLALAGRSDLLGPFNSIVRASIFGLNTLSVFVLCLRWGNGQLSDRARPMLGLLLFLQLASDAAGLLLVGAMTTFLIAVVAFTAGRGRVPYLVVAAVVLAFVFLHVGKADMRERFWRPDRDLVLLPQELPEWYAEWIETSMEASGDDLLGNLIGKQREGSQPLWWRSSTLQLLLLAQDLTPGQLPFMEGETYSIIPQLLVPRILNPNKLRTHEGTYRLNVHYGLQRYTDTYTTTIGWGLLNEAFANYGFIGVGALAVVLGAFYGWVTRFSAPGPLLSLRALFAILVLSYAFQTEFSAGVYVSALFQSSVALVALSFLIMREEWLPHLHLRRHGETGD